MPNHIENIIDATGVDSKKVIDELFNDKGEVTFDKFAPMPKELFGTSSPRRIVSQEEYDKAFLNKTIADSKGEYSMGLPNTQIMSDNLIEKYGYDNWYDWCIKNWGTKWGGYDGAKNNDSQCYFQTAWGTPLEAMKRLSQKFPEAKIRVRFADEDFGQNVGEYTLQSGVIIEQIVPEGGSFEALKMALEISGNDYYLHDYIPECFDEEEFNKLVENDFKDDEFVGVILDLILEEEIVPEECYLRNYLMKKAVFSQQFEYAKRIKDFIDGNI